MIANEIDELEAIDLDWSRTPDPLRPVGGKCEATGTCDCPRGNHDFVNGKNEAVNISEYFDTKDAFSIKRAFGDLQGNS